jgi:hypothetical protein
MYRSPNKARKIVPIKPQLRYEIVRIMIRMIEKSKYIRQTKGKKLISQAGNNGMETKYVTQVQSKLPQGPRRLPALRSRPPEPEPTGPGCTLCKHPFPIYITTTTTFITTTTITTTYTAITTTTVATTTTTASARRPFPASTTTAITITSTHKIEDNDTH